MSGKLTTRIVFPPGTTTTPLEESSWTDGAVELTATDRPCYIHVDAGNDRGVSINVEPNGNIIVTPMGGHYETLHSSMRLTATRPWDEKQKPTKRNTP